MLPRQVVCVNQSSGAWRPDVGAKCRACSSGLSCGLSAYQSIDVFVQYVTISPRSCP